MTDRPCAFILLLLMLLTAKAHDAVTLDGKLSCRRFTIQDGLPQMQTETVWQDAEGYIWIGTLSGFARYDGLHLTPYLKGQRQNVVRFTTVGRDVTAMGFRKRWRVDGADAVASRLDPDNRLLLNNLNASDLPDDKILLEDVDECNRRLATLTANGLREDATNGLFDRMTPDRKLFVDGDKTYVPTGDGLFVVERDNTARRLSARPDIYSLCRSGKRLLALSGDGLYAVDRDTLTRICDFTFESPDYGLTARERHDGALYIADYHNLYLFDHRRVTRIFDGINVIRGLLVDRWDRLWVATYQGVYLFFGTDFVNHCLSDGNDLVRSMGVDRDGHLVAGTLDGRVLVDGQTVWQGTPKTYFGPSAAAVGDTVYLVGGNDVARVCRGRVSWLGLDGERLRFVTAVSGDRLIIGGRQRLLCYHTVTGRLDSLSLDLYQPWCAAEDGDGRLWVGGSRGLYRVERGGRAVDATGRLMIVTAMCRDRRGRVYFASADSVFVIDRGHINDLTPALPAVSSHEVRSLLVSPRGALVVATLDGLLVTALDGTGHPTGAARWFDPDNGFTLLEPQSAVMAEQPDGTVWLAGLEGVTSFDPMRLLERNPACTVIIGPKPWWRRWPVWVAAMLMSAALCWWLAQRYERSRTRRTLEQLQRETRLKRLQIGSIQLKAIPHFHSNVLAGIEYFLMNNDTDRATHYLQVYNDFTNRTLTDIDREARTVDDEVDYVRKYLELEALRYGPRLTYHINIGDTVNRKALLPNMALYTYCQNAVKHGIGNKAEGGRIDITVEQHDNRVTVAVTDNGVGRAAAARLNTGSSRQGLRILHEQIDIYNHVNRLNIVETVTDLTDAHGQPAGTRFELSVPLQFNYNVTQPS